MTDASNDVRPLDGVRVLDIATFIAAPYCATILAEFGAEVIKIEQPGVGDPARVFGTPTERVTSSTGRGDTLVWLSESRNKQSITLDLRSDKGADLFKRLVEQSDVVCENFRVGTLEKWGLGWDTLRAINPRLVMLRVTGFGQTGPNAERPGFARIAQAFGGLGILAGMPDGPPVVPGSSTLADYMSGMYGALGVLMALRVAERTGEGQYIDIGLYESVFRVLDEMVPAYGRDGTVRERMGPATVNVCPHSHYQTKDGAWVAIACTNDKMFARFAAVMGRPELAADDRLGKVQARLAARPEVDGLVSAWTADLTKDEVLQACTEGEVPCGPLNTVADIFEDPQFAARQNLVRMMADGIGEVTVPSVVPRLSATPGRIDHLGPPLGDANAAVYGGLLGLSDADIEGLKMEKVI